MAVPYSQYYIQDLQGMKDRIENQIRQYQQQQQAPITQNFQIAPQTMGELEGKYASNIEEVRNTFVIKTGLFVDRELTTLWIKDISGKIRTFNLEEVIELDEKEKEILALKKELEEMRGKLNEYDNTSFNEQVKSTKSKRISNDKSSNAK